MFRSMTAYGRAHVSAKQNRFLIEIHSVNRKGLDITINLPKEFLVLDMDLRKLLSEEVKRGFVSVKISKEENPNAETAMPSLEAMKGLQKKWSGYAEALGYDPKKAISFQELLISGLSETGVTQLDEQVTGALVEGFKKALDGFISMREAEGAALLKDVEPRLGVIEDEIGEIEKRAEHAPEKYREKLTKRLEELELLKADGEDRMLRELVIFAEKIDITEELTRLRSHIEQFRGILQAKKGHIGRKIDFLIQEMNREANTMSSKSQDIEITKAVLAMKSEMEKIREQIQNIE